MNINQPLVTVLVPVRNEEHHIERCLYALAAQDYPRERIEVIVVDGMSDDRTRELVVRFVAESTLSRTIAELRRCLGDDAHQPRYIETIPRRGYRLLLPVVPVTPHSDGERPRPFLPLQAATEPATPWLGFLAGAACCGLAIAAVRWTGRRAPRRRASRPG